MTRLVLTLALAGCVSCTHRVETVGHTSVGTIMSRQVQNAADAGDGDLELKGLRQRLAANPADLDARILLAHIYCQRGLPDLAIEHERLALLQFPDSSIAALELAKTLRDLGQPVEARKIAGEFLAKHANASWQLLSLQGILEDERGDFALGEQAHRAALQVDPQQSPLHNNLGYNLLLQGHPEDAAAEFRRAIELDPRSQIAHNNLGAALIAERAPAEALSDWQRTGGPAVAHNNVGAILIEQGRYEEARAEVETALRFRADFPPALANLQLISQMDGQPSTIPATTAVSFWKRITSKLGWLVSGQ